MLAPEDSSLSPAGHVAAVTWGPHGNGRSGSAEDGVLVLSTPAGSQWLSPAAGSLHYGFPNVAWSPGGRYLGAMCKPGEGGSPHRKEYSDPSPIFGLQVFDACTATWLPQMRLQAVSHTSPVSVDRPEPDCTYWWHAPTPVLFSPCETVLAALCVGVTDCHNKRAWNVLIAGLQAPLRKVLVMCHNARLGWLEGLRLVVLDPLRCALACIQVDTPALARDICEDAWVPFSPHTQVAMHVLPSGLVVLLLYGPENAHPDTAPMTLSVHGSDMRQRSCVAISARSPMSAIPGATGTHTGFSVCACPRAVAAMCGGYGVRVYRLEQHGLLGSLLIACQGLASLDLSPGGHFLAGALGDAVYVLDTQTGLFLHRLLPRSWCSLPGSSGMTGTVLSVAWGGLRRGNLHVRTRIATQDGVLLSVVTFG